MHIRFLHQSFAGFCIAVFVSCLSAADAFADTISGTVYSDEGTTNIGANQTVSVSINGAAVAASDDTDASGVYSIPGVTINSGDVLTLYLNDETADAVTVTVGDGNDISNVDLYQNYLITRHDNGGSLTSAHLDTANNNGDADITAIYTVTTGSLDMAASKFLLVPTGHTFAPGANVTDIGGFVLKGGTLALATYTATVTGNWTYTSGSVTASTGTVEFSPGTITVSGSHTIPNVKFTSNASNETVTISGGTTLTVSGTLTLDGTTSTNGMNIDTGTINAQGPIVTDDADHGGSAAFIINGSGNQTWTGSASLTAGTMPNVEINKGGGTLTLSGTIRTDEDWTYTAGTIDPGTSTVIFSYGGTTPTITGSHTLTAVTFYSADNANYTYTITGGTTLTVTGTFTLEGSVSGYFININTGTIDAQGPVVTDDSPHGGTATILLGGSANRTWTGSGGTTGAFPNVEINTSGTLTLSGTIRTNKNWTYTAGTVDSSGATVIFVGNSPASTITGSHTLTNVTFYSNNNPLTLTIAAGTTITVTGTTTFDGSSSGNYLNIDTGTIDAQGPVVTDDSPHGGTATLLLGGSANRTWTGSGGTTGTLPNVVINTSGTLTLIGTIRIDEDWTYTAGTIDPGTSTVIFRPSGTTPTITGSHSLANVTFYSDNNPLTLTIAAATTLTVTGTTTIEGSTSGNYLIINTGTIDAQGAVVTDDSPHGGTATLLFGGSANRTWTSTPGTTGTLPNVQINTTGTLTLSGTIRTDEDWTYTAGTVDSSAVTVNFVSGGTTSTITGSHSLTNVTFYSTADNGSYTIAGGTTLTVTGTLTLDGNVATNGMTISTGTIDAQGAVSTDDADHGGTATILFGGSANRTWTANASTSGTLPNVEFNTSGTVTISGTVQTRANWTYTAGTIDSSAATIVFYGSTSPTITGSHTLNNVTFYANNVSQTYAIAAATTLTVSGTLTLDSNISTYGIILNTGTLDAQGTVVTDDGAHTGTATLRLGGSANRTWTGSATETLGTLPNVEINTSGTLTLSGTFRTNRSWTYTAGTVDPGTSTLVFHGTGSSPTISGSPTLNNVTFYANNVSNTYVIAASSTLTVTGTLKLLGNTTYGIILNTGTIDARGALNTDNSPHSGTSAILVGGSANRTWTGSASLTLGTLPNVEINTSGTLTLSGTIRTDEDWTYTAGTIDSSGATVIFIGEGTSPTITGSHTLSNVTFYGNSTTNDTYAIDGSTTLTVSGTLTLDGNTSSTGADINTGTIDAQGAVVTDDADHGGTGTLLLGGSANRTWTGSGGTTGTLPNVVINTSGTLTLSGTIRTDEDWTYTAGTIDSSGASVIFHGNGTSPTITGSHTLTTVTFFGDSNTNDPYAIAGGTVLTVSGTLTLDGNSSGTGVALNTGTINAQGAIFTDDADHEGSAAFIINGGGNQTWTGSASLTLGTMPNVEINKGGGTLTLSGTIRTDEDWTYTAGTIDSSGATVIFHGNGTSPTITGSHTLTTVTFFGDSNANDPYAIAGGTVLTVSGTLTLDGNSSGTGVALNTGTIYAQGAIVTDDADHEGSAAFIINGGGNQTWTGSASLTVGTMPNVEINKGTGTLTLSGTIRTDEDWTYTAGTMDSSGATVIFYGAGTTPTITGAHTLANVTFYAAASGQSYELASTLTVSGTLTLDGTTSYGISLNTGTINAQGAVVTDDAPHGGTGTLLLGGSANRTWTGSATLTAGTLPVVEINTSGTLTLSGTIRTSRNWTYTAGTIDGAGTVVFGGITALQISGSHTLPNVTFSQNGSSSLTYTIAGGTTLTVSGTTTFDNTSTGGLLINTGGLTVQGNVDVEPGGTYAGTTVLNFGGSGTQTFDLTGAETIMDMDITVNKTGGQVNLGSALTANANNQDLTIQEGTLDVAGQVLTVSGTGVTFTVESGGNLQLQGTETPTTPTFNVGSSVTYDGSATYTGLSMGDSYGNADLVFNGSGTWVLDANLDVNYDLTITSGTLDVDASSDYQINVGGDWTRTGTFEARQGRVVFDGSGTQTINDANTWHHLEVSASSARTVNFESGVAQTVKQNGSVYFHGASGQLLTLAPLTAATEWQLQVNLSGTAVDVRYVSVSYSNAGPGGSYLEIAAKDGTSFDGGNNTNWDFTVGVPLNISGTVFTDEGSTNIGSGKTVALSINGAAAAATDDTDGSGQYSFTGVTVVEGNTLALYLDGETEQALTVTVVGTVDLSNIDLYQDRLIVRNDNVGAVTNSHLDIANNNGDTDITDFYSMSALNVTVATTKELFVPSGETYAPGGSLTVKDIDINGTLQLQVYTGTVSGMWDATGGAFSSSNIVTFTATSGTVDIISNGSSFNTVVFNDGGGTATFELEDAFDADNNFIITGGTVDTKSGENNSVTVAGSWSNADTFTARNGTVTLNGTSGTRTITRGGQAFYNLTLNDGGGNTTFQLQDTLDVDGNLTITGGTLDVKLGSNFAITVGGNWSNADTFTPRSGTVTFDGTSGTKTLTSGGQAFNNLTFNDGGGTATFELQDALDVNGNLTITGGTLDAKSGGNYAINVAGNWSNADTFTARSGTVTFDGTSGTKTLTSGGQAFNDLTFNDGGGTATFELQDALDVDNNLTITGGTLDTKSGSNYAVTVGGNWSNADTFTPRSGTVTFDGTSGTKTLTSGGQAFNNLTFNDGGGTATFELQDALDVNGNLMITGGTLDTKSGGNYAINVAGNWSNADAFTARSGTVTLDGAAAQSVTSGASAYNTLASTNASASGVTFTDAFTTANLTDTTAGSKLTFNAGSTYTITSTLTLLGTLVNNVQLLSSSAGSRFTFDVTGSAQTVDYVKVKDSNASTNNITARNSIDLGNTDGPEAAPHWIILNPINSVMFGTDF